MGTLRAKPPNPGPKNRGPFRKPTGTDSFLNGPLCLGTQMFGSLVALLLKSNLQICVRWNYRLSRQQTTKIMAQNSGPCKIISDSPALLVSYEVVYPSQTLPRRPSDFGPKAQNFDGLKYGDAESTTWVTPLRQKNHPGEERLCPSKPEASEALFASLFDGRGLLWCVALCECKRNQLL